MSKYDKLKQQNRDQAQAEEIRFIKATQSLDELTQDVERTVDIYRNAEVYLDRIDEQFEQSTGLNKTDVAFLLLATALQIGRWVIIGEANKNITQKITDSRKEHNDKTIYEKERKERIAYQEEHKGNKRVKSKKHRDWENIVFESVPYDITVGSRAFGVNMEAGYHRLHTLGHDPILGWIFGTMNILSDTITLDNFRTFDVYMGSSKHWERETTLVAAFADAIDSVRENPCRLPAAVFAQATHLKSDEYTKLGLPVPVLETFAPNIASKLYKENYDTLQLMKDIAVYGVQAVVSVLINMLIAAIHGLLYNPNNDYDRDLYEVRTRKILMWSNIIASSSNVITVAGMEVAAYFSENAELAKKGWRYLDVGGYIITMYRIISDTKFIHKVKKEFLEKEWQKLVVGKEYTFISEGDQHE